MKISVVTVCFNSEATIAETLRSFVAQTHLHKELLLLDGNSRDNTVEIAKSFDSPDIHIFVAPDAGPFDAMNKGLRRYTGDAVGILNSDDTFHDARVLERIASGLGQADIVYGDLDFVRDQKTKALVRAWRAGKFTRNAFQRGWMPPHPTFYARRSVVDRVGEFDLTYRVASDYDFILRAMALNDFRVEYIPEILVDFQLGGISSKDWRATLQGNLECLRSRQAHLRAGAIDAALFLRPLMKIFQLRRLDYYRR